MGDVLGQTKGFEDFARTGQIRYPVHVTTRTASMFWGTLWIPVFAILITYLKDGPLALGVVGGLALTLGSEGNLILTVSELQFMGDAGGGLFRRQGQV